MARRSVLTVALLGVLAVAPHARAQESAVGMEFLDQPRLTEVVPVVVQTSEPGSFRIDAEVRIAGRTIVRSNVAGRTPEYDLRFGVPFTSRQRRAVRAAALRAPRRRVVIVIVLSAQLDGRPAQLPVQRTGTLRLAPFYDTRLRIPDVDRDRASRRAAVAFDLPGSWMQVRGALAGTPSLGSFGAARRSGGARCSLALSSGATTTRTPPRVRDGVLRDGVRSFVVRSRGSVEGIRFWRGADSAVAALRTPTALPGARPWTVVRVSIAATGDEAACGALLRRLAPSVLRRAATSVEVRLVAPQPGPGFAIA